MNLMPSRKKKSQSAMEYLMVVGLMTAILVPLVYLNFAKTVEVKEDVLIAETNRIGRAMVTSIQDVYYAPGFAKRTLDVQLPDFVTRVYSEPKGIVFDMTTNEGPSTMYFNIDVPVIVNINNSKGIGGLIIIKKDYKVGNFVVVCSEDLCTNTTNEVGLCNDGFDNDWDFDTDCRDSDCPPC